MTQLQNLLDAYLIEKPKKQARRTFRRQALAPQRTGMLLEKLGAATSVIDKWGAVMRSERPVAAPTLSQSQLLERIREVTIDHWALRFAAVGDNRFAYEVFELGPSGGEGLVFDLKEFNRGLMPYVRASYEDAWGLHIPAVAGDSVVIRAHLFGRPKDGPAKQRKASSLQVQPVARLDNLKGISDLKRVLAFSLDGCGLTEFGPLPKGIDAPKLTRAAVELEMRCQILRALMPIPRVLFGVGFGLKSLRNLRDQIIATALSQDLACLSPLRPEALTSFLASMPGAGPLPSIKLL